MQNRRQNHHKQTTTTVKILSACFQRPIRPFFCLKRKERRQRIPGTKPPPLAHNFKPNEGEKLTERQDKKIHRKQKDMKSKITQPKLKLNQNKKKT